jgi:hypothetical protein
MKIFTSYLFCIRELWDKYFKIKTFLLQYIPQFTLKQAIGLKRPVFKEESCDSVDAYILHCYKLLEFFCTDCLK